MSINYAGQNFSLALKYKINFCPVFKHNIVYRALMVKEFVRYLLIWLWGPLCGCKPINCTKWGLGNCVLQEGNWGPIKRASDETSKRPRMREGKLFRDFSQMPSNKSAIFFVSWKSFKAISFLFYCEMNFPCFRFQNWCV